MTTNRKGKSKKTNQELDKLRQGLVDEMGNLRIIQNEILSRSQSNQDAKIVWCINSLSIQDADDWPAVLAKKKDLVELLNAVQNLKLKPQKGRLKDLRRINEVVNSIHAKLVD
jgi:hypothetical protein